MSLDLCGLTAIGALSLCVFGASWGVLALAVTEAELPTPSICAKTSGKGGPAGVIPAVGGALSDSLST